MDGSLSPVLSRRVKLSAKSNSTKTLIKRDLSSASKSVVDRPTEIYLADMEYVFDDTFLEVNTTQPTVNSEQVSPSETVHNQSYKGVKSAQLIDKDQQRSANEDNSEKTLNTSRLSNSKWSELVNTIVDDGHFKTSTPVRSYPNKQHGMKPSRLKQIKMSNDAIQNASKIFTDIVDSASFSSEVPTVVEEDTRMEPCETDITDTQMIQAVDQVFGIADAFFSDCGQPKWNAMDMDVKVEPDTEFLSTNYTYEGTIGFGKNEEHDCARSLESIVTEYSSVLDNFDGGLRKRKLSAITQTTNKKHRFDQPAIDTPQIATEEVTQEIWNPITVDNNNQSVVRFKTASNKNITISDSALSKVRRIFDEIEDSVVHQSAIPNLDDDHQEPEVLTEHNMDNLDTSIVMQPVKIMGFQTASYKKLEISTSAMERVKNLFDGLDEVDTHLPCAEENQSGNITTSDTLVPHYSNQTKDLGSTSLFKTPVSTKFEIRTPKPTVKKQICNVKNRDGQSSSNNFTPNSDAYEQALKAFEDDEMMMDDFVSTDVVEDSVTISNGNENNSKTSTPNTIEKLTPNDTSSNNLGVPEIVPQCNGPHRNIASHMQLVQKREHTTENRLNELEKTCNELKTMLTVMEKRKTALLKQQKMFNNPTKQHISYRSGYLLSLRTTNVGRKSLRDALQLSNQSSFLTSSILHYITSNNACDLVFEFPSPPNPAVLALKDGAILIPSTTNKVGILEIQDSFLVMPGVDASKVPDGWIRNHFRWIVWKLASYDRQFPRSFTNITLTACNILTQLKYRYDRDIYANQRSAIRKITEKDEIASRFMVLCVSNIILDSTNNYNIQLTDGWYSIGGDFDPPLQNFVRQRKIIVGTKLAVSGSELKNLSDACHPLEVPLNVKLKIHCNATRRAAWYAKLGFYKHSLLIEIKLNSVLANGGLINAVTVYIARVLPMKFLEKMPDNKWVCRCANAEKRREAEWQIENEKKTERAQQEASTQLEKDSEMDLIRGVSFKLPKNLRNVTCAKTLHRILTNSTDPDSILISLSGAQKASIELYRSKLNVQRQAELITRTRALLDQWGDSKRTVLCILSVVILDAHNPLKSNPHFLEIRNPIDATFQYIKEDIVLKLYNVVSTTKRGNVCFNTTSQTKYETVPFTRVGGGDKYNFAHRTFTSIRQMYHQNFSVPLDLCDTVGVIVRITVEGQKYVWVTDEHQRLLRLHINMADTCTCFEGYKLGDCVVILNITPIAILFGQAQAVVTVTTTVTKYPTYNHLKTAIQNISKKITLEINDLLSECNEKIEEWLDDLRIDA